MANDDADDENDDGGDDEVDVGCDDDDHDDYDDYDNDEGNLVEWSDIDTILELRICKFFGCSGGITFPH